jgi:hypothetical protein
LTKSRREDQKSRFIVTFFADKAREVRAQKGALYLNVPQKTKGIYVVTYAFVPRALNLLTPTECLQPKSEDDESRLNSYRFEYEKKKGNWREISPLSADLAEGE